MKPDHIERRKIVIIVIGGIASIITIILSFYMHDDIEPSMEYERAALIMEESLSVVSEYCQENNINIDNINDPQRTGLIGPEMSDITTTIGHLEAKRTSLNPGFASLITHLLLEAGVNSGDTIALGCSGSFPGLMIAAVSAAMALDLEPRIILSLGSSSYGANNPDFTILDICNLLSSRNIFKTKPLAASLGGIRDEGFEFEDDIKEKLRVSIINSGIPLINERELQSNVYRRQEFYSGSSINKVKAFINTGGSYANMGTSPLSLKLQPGLVGSVSLPEKKMHGIIFSMVDQGIPVIHLLHVQGLSIRYNLKWDPVDYSRNNNYKVPGKQFAGFSIIPGLAFLIFFSTFLFYLYRLNNMHQ